MGNKIYDKLLLMFHYNINFITYYIQPINKRQKRNLSIYTLPSVAVRIELLERSGSEFNSPFIYSLYIYYNIYYVAKFWRFLMFSLILCENALLFISAKTLSLIEIANSMRKCFNRNRKIYAKMLQ